MHFGKTIVQHDRQKPWSLVDGVLPRGLSCRLFKLMHGQPLTPTPAGRSGKVGASGDTGRMGGEQGWTPVPGNQSCRLYAKQAQKALTAQVGPQAPSK